MDFKPTLCWQHVYGVIAISFGILYPLVRLNIDIGFNRVDASSANDDRFGETVQYGTLLFTGVAWCSSAVLLFVITSSVEILYFVSDIIMQRKTNSPSFTHLLVIFHSLYSSRHLWSALYTLFWHGGQTDALIRTHLCVWTATTNPCHTQIMM